MSDHRVTTLEQLRALVGEPHPATAHKVLSELDDDMEAFIARSPFLLLATVDATGCPEVSPKGDEAGFVKVVDRRTLLLPDRPGNRMILGLQNLLARPRLGLLFLLPGTGETLRVEGEAEILSDPALLSAAAARGRPAVLVLRVAVTRAFFHCARALLRSRLWDASSWPEPGAISLGRAMARQMAAGEAVARAIDERVAKSYREDL